MGCKTASELLDELDGRGAGVARGGASSSEELGGVIFICRCVLVASRAMVCARDVLCYDRRGEGKKTTELKLACMLRGRGVGAERP